MAGSSRLLTIGLNFLLCSFHLFCKVLNINIKCPRVHCPAFCSTGCVFYKSIVKKHILAIFGLMVSNCFYSVLLVSLALLFSKCLWVWAFLPVLISKNTYTCICFLQNFALCTVLVPLSPSHFFFPSSVQPVNSSCVFQLNLFSCLFTFFVMDKYVSAN